MRLPLVLALASLLCASGACSKPAEPESPSAGSIHNVWPRFRGPGGLGVADASGDYPVEWSAATGTNILWNLAVPSGHSSPIVCDDRLFLTAEAQNKGRVLCIATTNGAVLWDITVASAAPGEVSQEMGGGLCAPTPVTDGRHVWSLFATGDLVCTDFNGTVLWNRRLCDPVNSFGLGSSPVVWKDSVIVQLDQGTSVADGLSVILAVDKRTGKELWSTPRPVPNSWATPILIEHDDRHELVTCANPWVIAYDPDTGRELWRARGLGGDVVPSPTYAGGLVFAANAESKVLAIRPGGSGDVTATHVAWTGDVGLPSTASPVADGERSILAEMGELTCYAVATGEILWRATAGEGSWASPTLVGRRVYLPDKMGRILIFALGDRFELLAEPDIGDEITATPAFVAGHIYLRTAHRLFCIGKR